MIEKKDLKEWNNFLKTMPTEDQMDEWLENHNYRKSWKYGTIKPIKFAKCFVCGKDLKTEFGLTCKNCENSPLLKQVVFEV